MNHLVISAGLNTSKKFQEGKSKNRNDLSLLKRPYVALVRLTCNTSVGSTLKHNIELLEEVQKFVLKICIMEPAIYDTL